MVDADDVDEQLEEEITEVSHARTRARARTHTHSHAHTRMHMYACVDSSGVQSLWPCDH